MNKCSKKKESERNLFFYLKDVTVVVVVVVSELVQSCWLLELFTSNLLRKVFLWLNLRNSLMI